MILAFAIVGWLLSTAVLGWSLIKANQRLRDARVAASVPCVQFTVTRQGVTWEQPAFGGNTDPRWDNVCGPQLRLVDDA